MARFESEHIYPYRSPEERKVKRQLELGLKSKTVKYPYRTNQLHGNPIFYICCDIDMPFFAFKYDHLKLEDTKTILFLIIELGCVAYTLALSLDGH